MNILDYKLVSKRKTALAIFRAKIEVFFKPNPSKYNKTTVKIISLIILTAAHLVFAASIAPNAIPNITVQTGSNTTITGINSQVVNPANRDGFLVSIDQADKKAILIGPSFDIGRASAVTFNHTGGTGSATLIRITGPSTTIEGSLSSLNGQIYLINQNGILFGNGARVNTNGLVASALEIKDSDFLNDLGQLFPYADSRRPAYSWNGDVNGFANSLVQLAPDAKIVGELGSSVFLFAPKVLNQGAIETKSGQVVMAAGSKVYLSFAPDPNIDITNANNPHPTSASLNYLKDSPYLGLAGVLVEVDPYASNVSSLIGGTVTNDVSGRVLSQAGNVTFASFAVNQLGRVVATTSVSQKGSIRLLARDTVSEVLAPVYLADGKTFVKNGSTVITASRAGNLTFGEDSQTLILPEHSAGAAIAIRQLSSNQPGEPTAQPGEKSFLDLVLGSLSGNGGTITDAQTFNQPTLEAIGRNITVSDNSDIVVAGGFIKLSAQLNGDGLISGNNTSQLDTRLYLGKNTLIDASGLKNVTESMDQNFVQVLLTTNDLQDDPLNKNGFLYHKNVWVDIRHLPNSQVANLSGYLQQVPKDIAQKLTPAGSVKLYSEGDFIQRVGSLVDVSGGSVNFTSGNHKETWVLDAFGNAYPISLAPIGTAFTGFLSDSNARIYLERSYIEGAKSGDVNIQSFSTVIDGQFNGAAIYGDYQRNSLNLGGSLTFLSPQQSNLLLIDNHALIAANFSSLDALQNNTSTSIEADTLNKSGFESFKFTISGDILTKANLNLLPGSNLSLTGNNLEIRNDITARSGSVSILAKSILVDQNAKIDLSGLWVNDYISSSLPLVRLLTKGGSFIANSITSVSFGQGSLVDVSGGGWLNYLGKINSADAGNISIASNVTVDQGGNLFSNTMGITNAPLLNGEFRGFALGVGGSLSIVAPFLTIGSNPIGDSAELFLNPSFFNAGGFTNYNITGRDGVLVQQATALNIVAKNFILNNSYIVSPTGSHVADFATLGFLEDFARSPTSLNLSTQAVDQLYLPSPLYWAIDNGVQRGSVVVQSGANISVDSYGKQIRSDGTAVSSRITLSSWDNQLFVDGTLKANGGKIVLNMLGNPSAQNDNDFNPYQAIWLGSNSKLIASGFVQYSPNYLGLRVGSVIDGGSVTLNAQKGFIFSEKNSLIDVSGVQGIFDILGQPTQLQSNGGVINLIAREGMMIDGTFNASSRGALGGSLNVNLGRGASDALGLVSMGQNANYPGYSVPLDNISPNQKWVIDITQDGNFTHGVNVGSNLQQLVGGDAKLAVDSISTAGFRNVALKSADTIEFNGAISLNILGGLRLDAPSIVSNNESIVSITASNLMLSNAQISSKDISVRSNYSSPDPISGQGLFNVQANLISLVGNITFSGFEKLNFLSSGDIGLRGFSNDPLVTPNGIMQSTGLLTMTSRQTYPTSFSNYTIAVEGYGGHVIFNGTGLHDAVLSAGGKLSVNAETIDQNGVVLAPFGAIIFNATKSINLNSGSLTSVSANGATIPFGYTDRDGIDYLYNFGPGVETILAPPERVVSLNAPRINQSQGSVIDISAGGDLYAYGWVPGIGGSSDVLANGINQNMFSATGSKAINTWAILPNSTSKFGYYDPQYWNGSDIREGDAVYLSGMSGLAAGYYTLLPARYALLPGAMLVTSVADHQDLNSTVGIPQNDGSVLVAGHLASFTNSGYISSSRVGGFLLRNGTYANQLAEYTNTLVSQKFLNNINVMRTIDAGRVSLEANNTMILDGTFNSYHESMGQGSQFEIAAPNLLIVNHGDQTGLITLNNKDYLAIDVNTLNNLQSSSLILGGAINNGVIKVLSDEVRLGVGASLSGQEVILVANKLIDLQNNSALNGNGNSETRQNLTIGSSSISGNGALLRVSGGSPINITRLNNDYSYGILMLENGATVQSTGTIQLESTYNMTALGTINASKSITVSSNRISIGSPKDNASITNGLWITQNQLTTLANTSELILKSYSTIDLYGNVKIDNTNLNLFLNSAGISGYEQSGTGASINSRNISISNSDNVLFNKAINNIGSDISLPLFGNGLLTINAHNISSGANSIRFAGFNEVKLIASEEVSAIGTGEMNVDRALTLTAPRLTTQSGSNYKISANNGDLIINGPVKSSTLAPSLAQAANLELNGSSVTIGEGGNIDAAGANIFVNALSGDISVKDGASISTRGSQKTINGQPITLSAGEVSLISVIGNIDLQKGSLIDVSAIETGSAGLLNVTAVSGNAEFSGQVNGGVKGNVSINVKSISDINQALDSFNNGLNGFLGSQSYHVRTGDSTISRGALTQNFSLTNDGGAINIASLIDSSGQSGGSINIFAKTALTIESSAVLNSKGLGAKNSSSGTTGDGGFVILSSDGAVVDVQSGALIDVSGSKGGLNNGVGGNVILRAMQTGDYVTTGGVKVTTSSTAAIKGAKTVLVEATKIYNSTIINTSLQTTVISDAKKTSNFLNSNPIAFNKTQDDQSPTVISGIEIRSASDLTLSDAWTLPSIGTSSEILTLRAGGNLLLNKNLSYQQFNGDKVFTPINGSWNYRLIGGAELSSVNPELVDNRFGNVIVNASFIRTGSGFIDLMAGGDISLGTNASIYTEGTPIASSNINSLISSVGIPTLFPVNGKNVTIKALGSIKGQAIDGSQSANDWLYRGALATSPGIYPSNPQIRWWPDYKSFTNGIGALGGGDVFVQAGGDITNLQFASATNGFMIGDKDLTTPALTQLVVNGGGNVTVIAQGSVDNVMIVAGKGDATSQSGGTSKIKFELMDASASAYAGKSLVITDVSNPTISPAINSPLWSRGNKNTAIYFYSYSETANLTATSAAGNLYLENVFNDKRSQNSVYPSMISGYAPYGNVTTQNFTLYPSSHGNAKLIAGNDLTVNMNISDMNPLNTPQILTYPIFSGVGGSIPDVANYKGSDAHTAGLLHISDINSAIFYAGNDVIFNKYLPLSFSKSVNIFAGGNVVDPNLIIQNNKATDISVIKSVGNIYYTDSGVLPDGSIVPSLASLQIAGPGRLHLIAGGNIDLGTSMGVRSVGDLYNPYLTAKGADIMVLPGAVSGINMNGMITTYLDPLSSPSMAAIHLPELVSYMESREGVNNLNQLDALTQFKTLSEDQQTQFINDIFYSELKAGGRDAIDPKNLTYTDYTRSERAILTMFPNFTSNSNLVNQIGSLMQDFKKIQNETILSTGNLSLFYSQVRSESGGRIELMVPEGFVNAGLAVAGTLNKPATDLGIVSIRGGEVYGFVRNNFQVNQSRVFTLGGSDLMLYSALTNIDAGRGAKTSSATPPPTLRIRNGQITYDYSSVVSGSGIAALTATGGQPGTVDLFAPYGEINAGEAGIRSAGNINLGASVIIGRENISAGGVTSGAPVASVAGLNFTPVSAESNNSAKQGDKLSEAASKSANKTASALPSLITVEVIALGDDAASSSDPEKDEKKKAKKQ